MDYVKKGMTFLEEKMKQLYPLEQSEKMSQQFLKKQMIRTLICCVVGILFVILTLSSDRKKELCNGTELVRPKYDEANKEVTLNVKPIDKKLNEEEITVEVTPREYSYKEFRQEIKKGKKYVDKIFLNENSSANCVKQDLFFPNKVENSFLCLEWSTDKEQLISAEGKVNNWHLKKEELVTITVTFLYKNYEELYEMFVFVYPPNLSENEKFSYQLREEIQLKEEEKMKEVVSLPKEIDGKKVLYSEPKFNYKMFVFLPIFILLFVFEGAKEELNQAEKKRNQQLKLEYPELMNQIAILLSAGMTIRGVFGKLTEQYEKMKGGGKRKYAYEEIAVTYYEMQNGLSEGEALERMGERIKLIPYRKLLTLLSQNGKKGSKDLIHSLEMEGYSAYEERKEMVKALGEEAGTKLLVPMLIMLVIVLTILIVPVFMTF